MVSSLRRVLATASFTVQNIRSAIPLEIRAYSATVFTWYSKCVHELRDERGGEGISVTGYNRPGRAKLMDDILLHDGGDDICLFYDHGTDHTPQSEVLDSDDKASFAIQTDAGGDQRSQWRRYGNFQ